MHEGGPQSMRCLHGRIQVTRIRLWRDFPVRFALFGIEDITTTLLLAMNMNVMLKRGSEWPWSVHITRYYSHFNVKNFQFAVL